MLTYDQPPQTHAEAGDRIGEILQEQGISGDVTVSVDHSAIWIVGYPKDDPGLEAQIRQLGSVIGQAIRPYRFRYSRD